MHDGRGAKGSINDRIASFLYRLRYKKYILKKKQYFFDEQKVKIDYIDNLICFKEKGNQDVLDKEDKKVLPKVDLEIKTKKNITSSNIRIIKKYKLPKKVMDLKKEKKKVELENKIVKRVETNLKEQVKEVKKINNELIEIKENIKKVNNKEDLEKYKKRYYVLQEKLKKIKKELRIMREKYNFSDYSNLSDEILSKDVSDYKDIASLKEIEIIVDLCQKETDKLNETLIKTDDNNLTLTTEITKKEDKIETDNKNIGVVNMNLESYFDTEKNINKHEDDIKVNLSNIKLKMYKVYDKIKVKKLVKTRKGDLLTSLANIATGILTIPISNIKPNKYGVNMIKKGINMMKVTYVQKEVDELVYYNLEDEINNGIEETINLENNIDNTYSNLIELENDFKYKFNEYKNTKKYQENISKINVIKKVLEIKKEQIQELNKDLLNEKEKNKIKLMRK